MACNWIEGFESHIHPSQMARKYAGVAGSIAGQAGRVFGTSGAPSSAVFTTPSFGTDNTFVQGIGLRFNSHTTAVNSGAQGWYVELGPDEQCHVEMESTSGLGFRFHIKRGATIVATSSYFDFGVWHYFEWKFTVRTGTNGAYELRHNGVLDISDTLVNLADTGGDGWDVWAMRFSSNLTATLRMDDIYILDGTTAVNNDFLGPSIVEGLLPNAEGATIQWTPGSGTDNSAQVDDVSTSAPDDVGAGGVNGSDTNTQQDLYAFEDLQQITGAIHAVQVGVQLAMASAGTRTVKTKYRDPDTTVVDGTTHVVDSTIFDEFTEVQDLNPNSGLAWDVADIDGGQFGIEVVS